MAVLCLFCLFGLLHTPVAAGADPLAGDRDVYIKDSILALFLPSNGSDKGMKSRVISFDALEPGAAVSNRNAHVMDPGADFGLANGAKPTGTPGAMGRIRDDDGMLRFAVADYGGGGLRIKVGRIGVDGAVETPSDYFHKEKESGFDEIRATDVVLYDVTGDGVEDFIIGEAFYRDDDEQQLSFLIVDGANPSRYHREVLVDAVSCKTPLVRLDVGDFTGEGKMRLAVAYSNIPKKEHRGRYYFRVYTFAPAAIGVAREYETDISYYDEEEEVLDLAVGDYNGDGRDEVLVVSEFYQTEGSNHSECHFKHFYYDGGWKNSWATLNPSTARNRYDGAVAEAYDLDKDGRDEFVWMMPDSSGLFMLGVVRIDVNNQIDASYRHEDQSTDFEDYSLYKVQHMAVGSFSGRTRAGYSQRAAGEVVVVRRSWDGQREALLTVYDADLDANGRFQGLKNRGDNYTRLDLKHYAPLLLPGNILGESLRVGPGELTEETESLMITTVLQMPPKHVDYISVPWSTAGLFVPPAEQREPELLVATMYEDFDTSVTTSQTNTKESSLSKQTTWGLTGGFHLNVNTKLQLDFAANAGGEFMEQNTVGSEVSAGNETFSKAKFYDQISYTITSREIWRYIIPDEKVLSGDEMVQAYYEFTNPTGRVESGVAADSAYVGYNPIHERYNALSYPSRIADTLDYDPDRVLSDPRTYQTLTNANDTLTWTQKFTQEDERSNNFNFDATLTAGVALGGFKLWSGDGGTRDNAKMILEGTFGGKYFQETASVLKSTWEGSAAIAFNLGDVEQQAKDAEKVWYSLTHQAIRLPNGAVQLANSVLLDNSTVTGGGTDTLWSNPHSVYKRYPDLALNLPAKFKTQGIDLENGFVDIEPQAELKVALQMRGLRILNKSGSEYPFGTPGIIPRDLGSSTISFPIHNYSTGQDVDGGFEVRVSLIAQSPERLTLPGGKNTPTPVLERTFRVAETIPHHQKERNNWIFAGLDADFSAIPVGNYWLFVELDTGDEFTEVHEAWDYYVEDVAAPGGFARNPNGDPGGNNLGYFPVSVVDILDAFEENDASSATISAAATVGGRLNTERAKVNVYLDLVESPDLTPRAIREALEAKRDIPLAFDLWYEDGPEFVPGLTVIAIANPDDGGGGMMIGSQALPGLERNRRYRIDTTLARTALLFLGEKSGKLNIRAVGVVGDLNLQPLHRELPYGGDDEGYGGGSSGCNGGAAAAVSLLVAAMWLRRRG